MSDMDIGTLLSHQAETKGDRPFVAFADDDRVLTYADFNSAANRVANGLGKQAVEAGTPVALMLPNGFAYLASAYALKKIGAVEVAVNGEFRGQGLARMINLTKCTLLITAAEYLGALAAIERELQHIRTVVIVSDGTGQDATQEALPNREVIDFAEFESHTDSTPAGVVSDSMPATIMFTSGTSGVSKGCVLSHRLAAQAAKVIVAALDLTLDDCVYTPYPLYHMRAAYLDVLPAMLVGGRVSIARRFSASRFWSDLRRHDATLFSLIGTVMRILWNADPTPLDRDHSVRVTWGGPISVDPIAFEDRFGIRVLPGEGVYGMTEVGMVSMSSFDPGLSGRVQDALEVRIASDDDSELPHGELGEILIRPRHPDVIFNGYYGMPEATLEACRNLWFHTGDLGRLDEAGRLSFLGRTKEMIRYAGHNISTWEIEEVVVGHPHVSECAAIGVPNELGEERVMVYIEPQPGAIVTADDIKSYCRERMAAFMVPSYVEVVDVLPRTSTGKVEKGALIAAATRFDDS